MLSEMATAAGNAPGAQPGWGEEPFPLEAELSEPGPVESVDSGAALKSKRQTLSNDTRVIQTRTHAFS